MENHEFDTDPLPAKAEGKSKNASEEKNSKFSEETLRSMSEKMMGNKNATKNKPFRDMLTRKIIQNPHKLEKIVDTILNAAEEGESWAAKEVIDRLDGKAVMTQEISGPEGGAIETSNITSFTDELLKEVLVARQKEQE